MFKRLQDLKNRGNESAFLWGARQTGKSTLLKALFPRSPCYDFLLSDVYEKFSRRPSQLRAELSERPPAKGTPVLIDEVQLVPDLLPEIQWMIVNLGIAFILSGSSPRKLKRVGANLLGGRALRYELFPLVWKEIPGFKLERALNQGLLPRHYLLGAASPAMQAYVGDYLKEEIAAEARQRRIPTFSRFLEAAALTNGEVVNQTNIARECGLSVPTVSDYFDILVETLVGRFVPAYQARPKRRIVSAPRFYFFDVGLANYLLQRGNLTPRSEAFGKAFEHFMFQELKAHAHYSGLNYPISYWRTTSQYEVDFVLGHNVAVEIKSTEEINSKQLRGLNAFGEEYPGMKRFLVSRDPTPKKYEGVRAVPWTQFLEELWSGAIIH
jgi:predicted AAA+ superfamily ATPase